MSSSAPAGPQVARAAGARWWRPRAVSLTDRARALLAAGALLAVAGALLGFVDLVRLGLLLLALPLVAAVVGFAQRPALSVSRTVTPSPVPAGATADVITTLTQTGRRGTAWTIVEDTVTPAGPDALAPAYHPRFDVPPLAPGQGVNLHHRVTPQWRGTHRLGPLTAQVTDPFGLVRRRVRVSGESGTPEAPGASGLPDEDEFVALTPLAALTDSPSATDGREAEEAAAGVVAPAGDPSSTVREYRAGDDPRRIHWSASARHGDLLVRVEEQASTRRVVLVLDQTFTPVHGRPSMGLDWAVELLASAATALAASGHVLHLVTADRLDLPGASDPVSAAEAIAHLSILRPVAPDLPAAQRVTQLAADLAAEGGLLVVAAPARAELAEPLLSLRPGAVTGLVFLVEDGRTPRSNDSERLASAAEAGGWHAVPVRPDSQDVAEAWHRVAAAAHGRSAG